MLLKEEENSNRVKNSEKKVSIAHKNNSQVLNFCNAKQKKSLQEAKARVYEAAKSLSW